MYSNSWDKLFLQKSSIVDVSQGTKLWWLYLPNFLVDFIILYLKIIFSSKKIGSSSSVFKTALAIW